MTSRSTYRLQLHPGFDFAAAADVADYLAALGVTHVYASPYLQTIPGSMHGYDVVDHAHVRPDLGGEVAHRAFCERLRALHLGQLLDIVPNHMAVHPDNAWWWDVLENGPSSAYARYFDVDWDPPESRLRNLVIVPVLADHYGRLLDSGLLTVRREGARFVVGYEEHRYPLAPRSLDALLEPAAHAAGSDELAFLAEAFGSLPIASSPDPDDAHRRHRDKEVLHTLLDRLLTDEPAAAKAVDAAVQDINADADQLHALLERQNYRLTRWQFATHDLDYRRFFDVTGLVGLRMEHPRVFHDAHALVIEFVRRGMVDGLRVDHIDGLRDPAEYLERLAVATDRTWVVVEKILEHGEDLPPWRVAGTTGYEFLALATGVLVDQSAEADMTAVYEQFTGEDQPYGTVLRDAKRQVLEHVLAADLARLANAFTAVCESHRNHRDHSRVELAQVLTEALVAFPIYRTYVRRRPDGGVDISAADRRVIDQVLAQVAHAADVDQELVRFLGRILRLELPDAAALELGVGFQQLSGPVMAKGVEDTAFYRYNRFVALNDVGCDPARFGCSVDEVHAASAERQRRLPSMLLATSTHDTKRAEDVRARLAVLSELPDQWARAVSRWAARNERYRTGDLPDRNFEYLLYQTLVGAHPLPVDRAVPYFRKAIREAKRFTSWLAPEPAYEQAVEAFVRGVVGDADMGQDLAAFVAAIEPAGMINALTQLLLKLISPGVPDVYQGTELWDHSLVDPDNRRPVDFAARRALLAALDTLDAPAVLARAGEGLPKLWVLRRALQVRQQRPDVFGGGPEGAYEPLYARGDRAAHVVAFLRGGAVAAIGQRLALRRGGPWLDTEIHLPVGRWIDVLSGQHHHGGGLPLDQLLELFPVALLVRSAS